MKTGTNPIAIPASDGTLVSYGGFTVCDLVVDTAGSADLIIYDNTSGSGNEIIRILHTAAPNTYSIQIEPQKGLYAKNVSGWTATVWTD